MPNTDVLGVKNPRFTINEPGELATLEAEWLKKHKNLDVTPAQVRGVLMWHGEFQRSPEREAQRQAAREARLAEDAKRAQERADRKAQREAKKQQDEAAKAEKKAAKENSEKKSEKPVLADKPASSGDGSNPKPAPAKKATPSKLGPKKTTPATANVEF